MATDKQDNRTLGGYKATLHNPNTSEHAKQHAAEVLHAHGEELSASDATYLPKAGEEHHGKQHHVVHESHGWHEGPIADEGQGDEHDRRVLGGFKATLDNPNASEQAKDHAAEILVEHGVKI